MKKVIIVGAGLVGSLWAIFMARRGYRVMVYERRPDMRKGKAEAGRSINLAMSDRGLKALGKVGIDKEILAISIPMPGRMIHDVSGKLTFQPYGREGQHINSVSRAGLNIALMNKAEELDNVTFLFNRRCEKADLASGAVHFHEENTGKMETVTGDLVFGTDGAFSALRSSMQITERFDYSQSYLAHGYKELVMPAAAGGGWRMEKNALHIWPRKSFMLIALPNFDGSFTCTLFFPFEGPLSFASVKTPGDARQLFKEQFPDALENMPAMEKDFVSNPASSLVTIRCSPWTFNGKIALMGDAAHAIIPFYGQGMNAGFEDCTVMDELMEKYGDDAWDTIFGEYEALRKPNGDAIGDLALKNFVEMRDKVGDPLFLKRKALERRIQEEHPEFVPQYSAVSFSHIPYAEAKRIGEEQDKVFERMMAIPDVENMWDSVEVRRLVSELLGVS